MNNHKRSDEVENNVMDLLHLTCSHAARYMQTSQTRSIFPSNEELSQLSVFDESFPQEATSETDIINILNDVGQHTTVATTNGRYFGFVIGGILPIAIATNWLMSVWDQNGGLFALSPLNAKLEQIVIDWLIEALGLPKTIGAGFVTGATMANFTALAAARHHLLERVGWQVEEQGLFDAPSIKIVVGEEVHASVLEALMLLGFGRERVIRVPIDNQGRMLVEALPQLDDMTIVCIQAGNVNTGAFDPASAICDIAHEAGAWVHVDGAFGLWALASPTRRYLAKGMENADSWSLDGHKWLNTSFDNGIAICRYPESLRQAMSITAPYILSEADREPYQYVPEMSRRARGIEVWAVLKHLGKKGLSDLIDRCCDFARYFADELSNLSCTIHNDVELNQILVSFEDDETTQEVIEFIQNEGIFWAGSSVWQGHKVLRISMSSWATTKADIDMSIASIERAMVHASRENKLMEVED